MSPMKARAVSSSLEAKGFRRSDTHHMFFHLWVGGLRTAIHTKMSHGEREIGDPLVSAMSRDLKLSRKDFTRLIECPMSQQEYIQQLRCNGHLPC
jgi:hypothetical protein